jgi:hypothetical protein
MDVQYFPHFIRKNFPEAPGTNEQLIEIGKEFKAYLEETFKGKEDKLVEIWNISPMKVIMNSEHPLKVNGYDPVFVFHFTEFVEKIKKELNEKNI